MENWKNLPARDIMQMNNIMTVKICQNRLEFIGGEIRMDLNRNVPTTETSDNESRKRSFWH